MKRFATLAAILVAAATVLATVPGCSKDDNTTTPPVTTTKLYVQLKANAQYTFKRQDLDSNSAPITASARTYNVVLKGNGGLIQGAYNDWFYRIGTDTQSNEKDTLLIRTNTGSNSGTSFTQDIQVYGFAHEVLQSFSDLVTLQFGGTPPNLPGPNWDVVSMFQDQTGAAYAVGKEWVIGSSSGESLSFDIGGFPITATVIIRGKLESVSDKLMMGSTEVKAWKTTITITATLPLGSPIVMTMSLWFSDNPDGQVKVLQNSSKFIVPIVGTTLPIPGEIQELQSYLE